MKTKADILKILSAVRFMDREFILTEKGDGYLLQVAYMERDVEKPDAPPELQKSRKWYVSPHMTETEIVDTAFACCERSWGHVLREHFTYQGRRVFSPHFSVDARIAVCDSNYIDARPDERKAKP